MYSWDAPKSSTIEALERVDAAAFSARVEADGKSVAVALARAESGSPRERANGLKAAVELAERTGDYDEAHALAERMIASAAHADDSCLAAEARLVSAHVFARRGEPDAAAQAATAALELASHCAEQTLVSLALTQIANLEIAACSSLAALEHLDQAFSIGREQLLTGPKGAALAAVACGFLELGDYEQCLALLNRAQLLHERSEHQLSLGRTYNNAGVVHFVNGRFVSAIPYLERALDILGPIADVVTILTVLNNNVRAYESHYFERAAELRDAMTSFQALLADAELSRFGDRTIARKGYRPPAVGSETFADTLFAGDAAMLLPRPVIGR